MIVIYLDYGVSMKVNMIDEYCIAFNYRGRTLKDTLYDKEVERAMVKASVSLYKAKTFTSTLLGREVGNMYTASVYGGLASLLAW